MSQISINDLGYDINSPSSNSITDVDNKRNYQSQINFDDDLNDYNNDINKKQQDQISSLDIVVTEQAINHHFQAQQLQDLKCNHKIQNIELSVGEIIGLNGRVLQIQDQSREKQMNVLQDVLNIIASYVQINPNKNLFQINILVAEKIVSALIGVKGKQINQIKFQSNTQIIVNKPIQNLEKRSVQIDGIKSYQAVGKLENILVACKKIHELIDQQFHKVIVHQNEPTEAKFVMLKQVMKFVAGKDESFVKSIVQGYNVTIKLLLEQDLQCLSKDESIMIITGSLSNIQTAIVYIMRRINDFYKEKNDQFKNYAVKLLIKNIYVSKIIGASNKQLKLKYKQLFLFINKNQIFMQNIFHFDQIIDGKMIRELAAKSGGAQIKILSDKDEEKNSQDCVVSINGSLANKQDACCYIIAQLEQFRTGIDIEEEIDGRFQQKQINQKSRSRSDSRSYQKRISINHQPKNKIIFENRQSNTSKSKSPIRFYQRNKDLNSQFNKNEKKQEFAQYDRKDRSHLNSDHKIYKNVIDRKVADQLDYNNQYLLKKIERKSGSKIRVQHGQDGKYYVELKGTVDENKKAFGNIMEIQMKF